MKARSKGEKYRPVVQVVEITEDQLPNMVRISGQLFISDVDAEIKRLRKIVAEQSKKIKNQRKELNGRR